MDNFNVSISALNFFIQFVTTTSATILAITATTTTTKREEIEVGYFVIF